MGLCESTCPTAEKIDILVLDEFYAPKRATTSLFVVFPSTKSLQWITELLRWICTFPFGKLETAFQYSLRPYEADAVPSVSMMPLPEKLPRLTLGELDGEQRFVSTDGWDGKIQSIVSFEVQPHLNDIDKTILLDRLYEPPEHNVLGVLLIARKQQSPYRPTERLRSRLSIGEPECVWQYVPDLYLTGYPTYIDEH